MKYGLSDRTLQKIHGVLSHYPQIEKAILYGSRAAGTMGVNLRISHIISDQDLNRCRPYGAKALGQTHFYIDAVPTGLKNTS